MQKQWVRPIAAIAIALFILGGLIWVIDPVSGLFTHLGSSASAQENLRYAAKPAGWDGPAGSCVVCHSLEKGAPWRVAPSLWGIIGAPKAGAKGYGYSHALFEAGGEWTKKDLDDYLADPDKFLPGTKKTITGLPDSRKRAEIIAFLATLKD